MKKEFNEWMEKFNSLSKETAVENIMRNTSFNMKQSERTYNGIEDTIKQLLEQKEKHQETLQKYEEEIAEYRKEDKDENSFGMKMMKSRIESQKKFIEDIENYIVKHLKESEIWDEPSDNQFLFYTVY